MGEVCANLLEGAHNKHVTKSKIPASYARECYTITISG